MILGKRSGKTTRMNLKAIEALSNEKDILIVAHTKAFAEQCKRDIVTLARELEVDFPDSEIKRIRTTSVANVTYARAGWRGSVFVDHFVHEGNEGEKFYEQLQQQARNDTPFKSTAPKGSLDWENQHRAYMVKIQQLAKSAYWHYLKEEE